MWVELLKSCLVDEFIDDDPGRQWYFGEVDFYLSSSLSEKMVAYD